MSILPDGVDYTSLNIIRTALINESVAATLPPVGQAISEIANKCVGLEVSHLTLHFSTLEPSPTGKSFFEPIDLNPTAIYALVAELLVKFPDRVYQHNPASRFPRTFVKIESISQLIPSSCTLGLVLGGTETLLPIYPHF